MGNACGKDQGVTAGPGHAENGHAQPEKQVSKKQSGIVVTASANGTAADEHKPVVLEADQAPMRVVTSYNFVNWGETVKNRPKYAFVPKTKAGVCNLVRWAGQQGHRVRCSGYRHTWSSLFSEDSQVLVSMLDLDEAEDKTVFIPPKRDWPRNELHEITLLDTIQEPDGSLRKLCRIGAAVTNEMFRAWCLEPDGGNKQWTLPANVIMVEITFGGSNAPICHGAGMRHPTLSDLVAEIEFVNARGELQCVNDPRLLKAASGAFGLLGVVVSITLKLQPMSIARMKPRKRTAVLTIPPPYNDLSQVPKELRKALPKGALGEQQLQAAREKFIRQAEQAYYSEWFWFTLSDECWINVWDNDGEAANASLYVNRWETALNQAEHAMAQLGINKLGLPEEFLPVQRTKVTSAAVMAVLPAGEVQETWVSEALHFRRGIQNFQVRNFELELPIPPRKDDPTKPDWDVIMQAWWIMIQKTYEPKFMDTMPMRLCGEVRVMGGSEVTLAPQRGNAFGTAAIEVLTTMDVPQASWLEFCQELCDAWCALADPRVGPPARPHWAKQWQGLRFYGLQDVAFMKQMAYKEAIPEFAGLLGEVAEAGGYSLEEMRTRFSNNLLDNVIFDR